MGTLEEFLKIDLSISETLEEFLKIDLSISETLEEFLNRIKDRYYFILNDIEFKLIFNIDKYDIVATSEDLELLNNDDFTRLINIKYKDTPNFLFDTQNNVYFMTGSNCEFQKLNHSTQTLGIMKCLTDGDYLTPTK